MFFSKIGAYPAAGMFSISHLILFLITVFLITISLIYTVKKKKDVLKIIRILTIIAWIIEIINIIFKFRNNGAQAINSYVPLYYCSLFLYASILSAFCKGNLKRVGDVTVLVSGLAGGTVFLIYPSTSLTDYPAFHLVSISSFLYHGIMTYISVLMICTNYIKIDKKDICYYIPIVTIICIVSYTINYFTESNLMFISSRFPYPPMDYIYDTTGKFYPLVTSLAQITLPFYFMYGVLYIVNKIRNKKEAKD